jgi:hypothetical protein
MAAAAAVVVATNQLAFLARASSSSFNLSLLVAHKNYRCHLNVLVDFKSQISSPVRVRRELLQLLSPGVEQAE